MCCLYVFVPLGMFKTMIRNDRSINNNAARQYYRTGYAGTRTRSMHTKPYLHLLGALLEVRLAVDEYIVALEGNVTRRGWQVLGVRTALLSDLAEQDDPTLSGLQINTIASANKLMYNLKLN